MLKFYTMIFYMGILTSVFSGVGMKFNMLDPNTAGAYGLLGLFGTGLGYAGRHYLIRKKMIESGSYRARKKSR